MSRYNGKYPEPIQVLLTHRQLARIKAIEDREGCSRAQVIRDLIDYGIGWREGATPRQVATVRVRSKE